MPQPITLSKRFGPWAQRIRIAEDGITISRRWMGIGRAKTQEIGFDEIAEVDAPEDGRNKLVLTLKGGILLALPLGTRGGQLETASRIKQWMETAEREPKSTLASIADRCLEMLSDEERAISRAVEHLIIEAIRKDASDIHFEPGADGLLIRYRIDGMLHDVVVLPRDVTERVIARIKVMANLVTYITDAAQDGHMNSAMLGRDDDLRVSTFPTVSGEKAVIRILSSRRKLMRLGELGFSEKVVDTLRELIERPSGTILLTGPSGSGKTTTIYALLQEIIEQRGRTTNIVTIEDPAECRLEEVSQTEVNPAAGLTFANALRSMLRHDPEVIVVGEIRDDETARTAIQAGLTGHLVISTVHAGSSSGVFTRLVEMKIEPFLIASSVTAVLNQRLLRRLCPQCELEYKPSDAERAVPELDGVESLFHAIGCETCNGTGYSGRTAIGELITVDETVRSCVLGKSPTAEIEAAAEAARVETLRDSALAKAANGETSLDELKRVLGISR